MVVALVLIGLWMDSERAVRRLPLIGLGDAASGFRSAYGRLGWFGFYTWDMTNLEAEVISIPYWTLISACAFVAWRLAIRNGNHPKGRWWGWLAFLAMTGFMAWISTPENPVVRLVRAVTDPRDPYPRFGVNQAVVLVNQSRQANEAARRLIETLETANGPARTAATRALGKLAADANVTIPALISARMDRELRLVATMSLGQLATVDERVISALGLSLKDNDPLVRFAAASALFEHARDAEPAVPDLIEALKDNRTEDAALRALGSLGPKAHAAVPVILERLKSAKEYDQVSLAEALWKIDRNIGVVVPALILSLHDPYDPISETAARVLGDIGPPAREAIPSLIALRDGRLDREPVDEPAPSTSTVIANRPWPYSRDSPLSQAASKAIEAIQAGSRK